MNYLKLFLIIFVLKLIHDFFMWIYSYFLRTKWVSYFNNNNRNAIQYTYQIQKYIFYIPVNEVCTDFFNRSSIKVSEESFIRAHGYYRYKFFQNFNLFYWIELIIKLPQKILQYMGLNLKRKTINIINCIYWICSIIFTIYNDEIINFVKTTINLFLENFIK